MYVNNFFQIFYSDELHPRLVDSVDSGQKTCRSRIGIGGHLILTLKFSSHNFFTSPDTK